MDDEIEYARFLAEATIGALGDGAPDWTVEGVTYFSNDTGDKTVEWSPTVVVSLRSASGRYEPSDVYFTNGGLTLAESSVVTVDAIQDNATELTSGKPLPPCPGHAHPLTARVVDGVPRWVCMKHGPDYYWRDIIPGFRPHADLVGYMNARREPADGRG